MIRKLKESSIKKNFDNLLQKKEADKTISDREITTIGILSDDEISRFIDIKEYVENTFKPRSVRIYSYRDYSRKDNVSFKHFSDKDFNWKGIVNQQNFKSFLEEPFDLLIGYFNKKNLFLESAVLQSNASFKAGFSGVNQKLYDIEIFGIPNHIEDYLQELKKYLIILGKIKN